jgi:hypothetical protein
MPAANFMALIVFAPFGVLTTPNSGSFFPPKTATCERSQIDHNTHYYLLFAGEKVNFEILFLYWSFAGATTFHWQRTLQVKIRPRSQNVL